MSSDLKNKIRYALEPDNPNILYQYLSALPVDFYRYNDKSLAHERNHYIEQFHLLLETFSDDCLPSHWRCLCLDCINKPLFSLANLASCEQSLQQVKALHYELRVISHYFETGFYQVK